MKQGPNQKEETDHDRLAVDGRLHKIMYGKDGPRQGALLWCGARWRDGGVHYAGACTYVELSVTTLKGRASEQEGEKCDMGPAEQELGAFRFTHTSGRGCRFLAVGSRRAGIGPKRASLMVTSGAAGPVCDL